MKRAFTFVTYFFESLFSSAEGLANISAANPVLLGSCVILLTATLFFVPKPDALAQSAISSFVIAIPLLLYAMLLPFPSKREKTSKGGTLPPIIAFFVNLAGIGYAILGIDNIIRHFSQLASNTLDTMCYVVIAIYVASCLLEAGLRMLGERRKVSQKKGDVEPA